jgi:hypothetical protein
MAFIFIRQEISEAKAVKEPVRIITQDHLVIMVQSQGTIRGLDTRVI